VSHCHRDLLPSGEVRATEVERIAERIVRARIENNEYLATSDRCGDQRPPAAFGMKVPGVFQVADGDDRSFRETAKAPSTVEGAFGVSDVDRTHTS
jgi:hypothetical protein